MEGNLPRRETVHSMLRRLHGWDYRQRAVYQVTLTLADRSRPVLGRLEVRGRDGAWRSAEAVQGRGLEPGEVEARVVPSDLGALVARCWAEIPAQWSGVSLLGLQVMPEHVHGIIFVERPQVKALGNIVGSFKSRSTSRILAARGQAQDGPCPRLTTGRVSCAGPRALKEGVSCAGPRAAPFWSPGFQDTVLLREGQLANMKRYLADNPRRLAVKRLFPGLFRKVARLAVPLALPEGRQDRGWFSALGNRFLLDRSLVQVQVSRRDFAYRREPKTGGGLKIVRDARGDPVAAAASAAYAERKALLFAAARHGAVLISPCVSDGERQIAHEALQAGLPLVTMLNKGFSPLQKPGGRYFDACAAGRLLMLAPSAWPFQPGEKPMTRLDATAMNRLCQWISGEGAAVIGYHGMRPADIDALARSAAQVEPIPPCVP